MHTSYLDALKHNTYMLYLHQFILKLFKIWGMDDFPSNCQCESSNPSMLKSNLRVTYEQVHASGSSFVLGHGAQSCFPFQPSRDIWGYFIGIFRTKPVKLLEVCSVRGCALARPFVVALIWRTGPHYSGDGLIWSFGCTTLS